jgi:hypothetical protein
MKNELPKDFYKNQASAVIDRVRNLKTWEITRVLDEPLEFRGGPVPFDIKADQKRAWFKVIALTKQEAEQMVDDWMRGADHDL